MPRKFIDINAGICGICRRSAVAGLLTGILLILLLPLMGAGCGLGGETTVTVERTVTVTATGTTGGSSPEEKQSYINQINDITKQADIMNRDYRGMIEKYNQGQTQAADLAAKADQNWRNYEDLGKRLTEMKAPREYQAAHQQLISGFSKWRSAFEAYRDGFRDANNALLDEARDLDNQAATEVNQAINQITQLQ